MTRIMNNSTAIIGGRMNIKRDDSTIVDKPSGNVTLGGYRKSKRSKSRSRKNKKRRTMKRK